MISANSKILCGNRRLWVEISRYRRRSGGETGIRTLGGLSPTTVFETAPFDRSGTSPRWGRGADLANVPGLRKGAEAGFSLSIQPRRIAWSGTGSGRPLRVGIRGATTDARHGTNPKAPSPMLTRPAPRPSGRQARSASANGPVTRRKEYRTPAAPG